jgi:mono/diheme cytochrome c family protein
MRSLVNLMQLVALFAASATVVSLFMYRGPGPAPADVTLGAHVYDTTCVSCHGPLGEGRVGPQIGSGRALEIYPDRRVMLDLVSAGREGMPSFAGTLTTGEIGAVVDYVRDDLGR